MWIKDKVNDCYKMSHSHLITIEKVNRHYILYFRDIMIKSFPTLTAAKQYGDFFQLDSHTRYAIYLIHNFGNCTGNNLGYYTGTIGLQGDIYVPGHVPTINGEVKLYKTFARAKQGAQAIYNKCGYVQKFEIHTIEIRANDKSEDCEFLIRQKLTGKLFCKAFKDGEKELRRDIEGNPIMINGCAGEI